MQVILFTNFVNHVFYVQVIDIGTLKIILPEGFKFTNKHVGEILNLSVLVV